MTRSLPESIGRTVASIGPLDHHAMTAQRRHLERLTKPPGSLGRLEEIVVQIAGITGLPGSPVEPRTIVVAAADHGVAAQGVSAYPQAVTAQMVANFVRGGAAINALARLVRTEVLVVDVGVAAAIPTVPPADASTHFLSRPVRRGTADLSAGPAMTDMEAVAAIEVGLGIAAELALAGCRLVAVGEMGIANTTSASAIVCALTGQSPAAVTGRGTGIDDERLRHKIDLIERGLRINAPDRADPLAVLGAVGGLEIGCLVGVILGAAAAHIPVVLDGFITASAALLAAGLAPNVGPRLLAGHRSTEPGHTIALAAMGMRPLLELGMRLGEGSGAAVAIGVIDAACRTRDEMATFAAAGVAQREGSG